MKSAIHLCKLQNYAKKHGNLPSVSALPLIFECSDESAREIIDNLLSDGFLEKTRSGELLGGASFEQKQSPLSSVAIPAGIPCDLADSLHDSLNIHAYLVPSPHNTIIVPISGDSMIEAGIVDGDLGVIETGGQPKLGDIVAAEVDGLFTIKRLAKKTGGGFVLHPENKKYKDIIPKTSLKIHGILVGLARRY